MSLRTHKRGTLSKRPVPVSSVGIKCSEIAALLSQADYAERTVQILFFSTKYVEKHKQKTNPVDPCMHKHGFSQREKSVFVVTWTLGQVPCDFSLVSSNRS